MNALVLALLVSQACPSDVECLARVETMGTKIQVLTDERNAAGRALVGKDAQIAYLEDSIHQVPVRWLVIGGLAGLIVGGVVAGLVVASVKK